MSKDITSSPEITEYDHIENPTKIVKDNLDISPSHLSAKADLINKVKNPSKFDISLRSIKNIKND